MSYISAEGKDNCGALRSDLPESAGQSTGHMKDRIIHELPEEDAHGNSKDPERSPYPQEDDIPEYRDEVIEFLARLII